jgi:thiol-disulfide isomerase/thioredoxin
MKKAGLLISLCLLGSVLRAQTAKPQPLAPGSLVPDITLENILGYSQKQVRLSDFRGKLLILDLWTPNCPACIKSFPVLKALEEQFPGAVVVFPVSFGVPPEGVRAYRDKRKNAGHPIALPTAAFRGYDHPLLDLFSVDGFPQLVWIDKAGKLVGVSSSVEVTATNIRKVLNGERPQFASGKKAVKFDRDKPLLVEGNGGPDSAFHYRSLITPYVRGLTMRRFTKEKGAERTRIFMSNAPVADLVKTAIYQGETKDIYHKQLLLEVQNPARYLMPDHDSLFYPRLDSFAHCYELILPPSYTLEEAYDFMREDLCRYFRITVAQEKRPLRCWVLRHNAAKGTPLTRGGKEQYLSGKDEWWFSVRNRPLVLLTSFMNKKEYPLLVDETGLQGKHIDMDIRLPEGAGLRDWQKALGSYGLTLSEEERIVEMLVIR